MRMYENRFLVFTLRFNEITGLSLTYKALNSFSNDIIGIPHIIYTHEDKWVQKGLAFQHKIKRGGVKQST